MNTRETELSPTCSKSHIQSDSQPEAKLPPEPSLDELMLAALRIVIMNMRYCCMSLSKLEKCSNR